MSLPVLTYTQRTRFDENSFFQALGISLFFTKCGILLVPNLNKSSLGSACLSCIVFLLRLMTAFNICCKQSVTIDEKWQCTDVSFTTLMKRMKMLVNKYGLDHKLSKREIHNFSERLGFSKHRVKRFVSQHVFKTNEEASRKFFHTSTGDNISSLELANMVKETVDEPWKNIFDTMCKHHVRLPKEFATGLCAGIQCNLKILSWNGEVNVWRWNNSESVPFDHNNVLTLYERSKFGYFEAVLDHRSQDQDHDHDCGCPAGEILCES